MQHADIVIIGGGIVGLATGYQLVKRFPGQRVLILEKEATLACHQTGHNSGVLHSGIYYKPGSLKAINCREGKLALEQFCREHEVDYEICGKVIVATSDEEIPRLQKIFERGQANGVNCEIIEAGRLNELEPHAAGIQAIHVPESGIVDFVGVCEKLANSIREQEGLILTNACVKRVQRQTDRVCLATTSGDVEAKFVINCAGLHSDRVTQLTGVRPPARIVPFRGEYYELKPEVNYFCKNLIYPVPDPSFPFLGVHFTRMVAGGVECGPNAVLAFAREGYRKRDIHLGDLFESLTYVGFLRLATKYWRMGAGEMWRSLSKRAFVKALQKLLPEIRAEHLQSAPAGVRAQAVTPAGGMVDDFLIEQDDRVVNVCNAPSPAATSSLNIGRLIVDKLSTSLQG